MSHKVTLIKKDAIIHQEEAVTVMDID